MADIDSGFEIEVLSLDDLALIVAKDSDPLLGEVSPAGSLLLRNYNAGANGELYLKIGTLDTDWDRILTNSEIISLISASSYPTLDSLTDTNLNTPAISQALVFDGTTWINQTIAIPPAGGGRLVQVSFGPIPSVSGTANILITENLPAVTEGVPVWSQPFTPTAATSTIRISSTVVFSSSNNSMTVVAALFRDGICIGAGVGNAASRDSPQSMSFTVYDTPNTITQAVYQLRIGKDGGNGTWYINSVDTFTTPLGGVLENNAFTVEEIGT